MTQQWVVHAEDWRTDMVPLYTFTELNVKFLFTWLSLFLFERN